jgi:copper chaperone CopZ
MPAVPHGKGKLAFSPVFNTFLRNFVSMKHTLFLALCPFLFFLGAARIASAQFQNIYIGVNGLTCSQCTRTVEMSIRKLDFVADVDMNLQHTEGKITIKKNSRPDMDKIAQAIVNAGFSVRFLKADFLVDNSVSVNSGCFTYSGDQFVFTEAPKVPIKGLVKLKFIGKKYLPKSEFNKARQNMNDKCATAATGSTYHVQPLAP